MSKSNEKADVPSADRQQINIESMDTESLAILLNQQYQQLMQSQANITAINNLLEKRKQYREKDKTNGHLPST